jgi:hypothetical protein
MYVCIYIYIYIYIHINIYLYVYKAYGQFPSIAALVVPTTMRASATSMPTAAALASAGGGGKGRSNPRPTRMQPIDAGEQEVSVLPTAKWEDIRPPCSCLNVLRTHAPILRLVPGADIANDVEMMVMQLWFTGMPVVLSDDELAAIVTYTHDLQNGTQASNVYFELNKMLRSRGTGPRKELVQTWGFYMHYMMSALSKLPEITDVCWRGMVGQAKGLEEYKLGRPIQWGAFTSTTTDLNAAKALTDRTDGVLFKITVTSGRNINAFSFFPTEGEILLLPNHRFIVTSAPYQLDGYTVLDLLQTDKTTFVS